ncbi:MAG: LysR family transcriptional regulator [Oxalobacteraceae bacterium]|nr:MAG: LysR family transcriptional regulator [Oxalobacteraceae bacterium]
MLDALRRLDLNLLLTLDVLLEERNVTRAAARLHLSQPAVSVQLGRLRDLLGDPLLLPGPRGMRPTARADAVRTPLRQALEALQQALAPADPFDPAGATHTWQVAASDYGASTIVLPALAGLRAAAPGTRLAVLGVAPGAIARQAEQGAIDLAFHIADEAPEGMRRRVLFSERYLLAGRADHPRLRTPPTLAQFRTLEHVIMSPEGGGFQGGTDSALARLDLTRRVVLSVQNFLLLTSVLARTDLVALLPSRLLADAPGLRAVEPPLAVPGFEMLMLWPERVHRDPAHKWLRGHLAGAAGGPASG